MTSNLITESNINVLDVKLEDITQHNINVLENELIRKVRRLFVTNFIIDPRAIVKEATKDGPIFTIINYDDIRKLC